MSDQTCTLCDGARVTKKTVWVSCAPCRGIGRARGFECPICHGAGKLEIPEGAQCPRCMGSGKEPGE